MRALFAALALFTVTACQSAPQSYTLSPISFRNQPVIRLDVARINVVEEFRSPTHAPNVEHQMSMPPAQAVKIWANERLQAVGTSGQLDIVIQDASVKETNLPMKQGVRGLFTDDQSERYDATLAVTLRLYDGVNAMSRAEADVRASRSRSVNEKASLADREKLWHELSSDLGRSLDSEGEKRLRQYFGNYLR